jgi:NAD(P)H-dependent FMN reductase
MKISIISASHRVNSQSKKISCFLQNNLSTIDSKLITFILDLSNAALPLWSPEKKDGKGVWGETWNSISENLSNSDGFILVVPEYGGMATPCAKNIFLLCGNGELAHKPGLIVSCLMVDGGRFLKVVLHNLEGIGRHISKYLETQVKAASQVRTSWPALEVKRSGNRSVLTSTMSSVQKAKHCKGGVWTAVVPQTNTRSSTNAANSMQKWVNVGRR